MSLYDHLHKPFVSRQHPLCIPRLSHGQPKRRMGRGREEAQNFRRAKPARGLFPHWITLSIRYQYALDALWLRIDTAF